MATIDSFRFLAPAASGAPQARGTSPNTPAIAPNPAYRTDTVNLTGVRPLPNTGISPEMRRELDLLRNQVMSLTMRLSETTRRIDDHLKNGHCPCCGPNCACHTKGALPANPVVPNFPPKPWQLDMARPAWCPPGDPTCDPAANPLLVRPTWCPPGDPTCDPAVNPALARPAWCAPGDPSCDPAARFPSLLRPSWCRPGDPSCDPAANPSLLRPSWCNPGDPSCDPSANPSLLRPYWCKPGDPSCDPSATPSLLRRTYP